MENSHDAILIITIGAIIVLQLYVFLGNYRKVQDYKKTIQRTKDFEIVEVSVPEDWIKELEIDEILQDPVAFEKSVLDYNSKKYNGIEVASHLNSKGIVTKDDREDEIGKEEFFDNDDYKDSREDAEENQTSNGLYKLVRNKFKNILE